MMERIMNICWIFSLLSIAKNVHVRINIKRFGRLQPAQMSHPIGVLADGATPLRVFFPEVRLAQGSRPIGVKVDGETLVRPFLCVWLLYVVCKGGWYLIRFYHTVNIYMDMSLHLFIDDSFVYMSKDMQIHEGACLFIEMCFL